MLKTIKLKDAVGTKLAHDITEIRPGQFKGPAFRKGHTVCDEDICHLQRLGKNNLYQIEIEADEIHENTAAAMLAEALSGPGVIWENAPREGKIELNAALDGLLYIDVASLTAFNMVDEVMCATLHNHTRVKKGQQVAATRAIPLVMPRTPIKRAAAIASQNGAAIQVRPMRRAKVGLVITGNEVYQGLIQDRYAPLLTEKVACLESEVIATALAPDDPRKISAAIHSHLTAGCDLIMVTGGMSVDPDDVSRKGIQMAGGGDINYGAAALPGAMFLVAYLNEVPLVGLPACGLHHPTTVLDLMLPRLLAGERIGKKQLALLGHGGLCQNCPQCSYPHCPFGKGS